jgi:hypothetical protein
VTAVQPPTREQVAETAAILEQLGIPPGFSAAAAAQAMRQQLGRGVGTTRAGQAQKVRRGAMALHDIPAASAPQAREPGAPRSQPHQHSLFKPPLPIESLIDERLVGAACRGHHELFDPPRHGERDERFELRVAEAAELCAQCPVLAACDDAARELGKKAFGVWAGKARNQSVQRKALSA